MGQWAYIQFVDRPTDPGYGVDEGVGIGQLPSRPSRPGRPVDPGFGWGGGERPGHGLPRPPHTWPRPPSGGLPVDPDWGVEEGTQPDHGLPIHPTGPEHPDNVLPEVPGEPPPETDPPPGTIWPPLPPEVPAGKHIAAVWISGVGSRYVVIDIPQRHPDQGLPERPGAPVRPGQGLPQPPRPPQAGQLPTRPGIPPRPQPR
jgi:hypothetical protein